MTSSLQSSFENEGFSLPSGMLSDHHDDNHSQIVDHHLSQQHHPHPQQHTDPTGGHLSPLGTSDFAQHLQNIPMSFQAMSSTHTPPPSLSNMAAPNSMGGGGVNTMGNNISNTMSSGLTETVRSFSRNSHSPAMSDSGVSLDASSGGSGSNTPQVNLAQLAKMGNVSINNQGESSQKSLSRSAKMT